jgi:uncharacterized protein YndB with AHSA1/START domain
MEKLSESRIMATYDWSRFTKRIPIKAGKQEVFDSWTTPGALESWFLREARFVTATGIPRNPQDKIQKGDSYKWRWHGHSDAVTEQGTMLEQNGKDFLKFTFGKAGTVTVTVKEENDLTVCELVQQEIPTDEESKVNYHLGCSTGWGFFLANLKSLLEGGIDLRNKDAKIANVVTA